MRAFLTTMLCAALLGAPAALAASKKSDASGTIAVTSNVVNSSKQAGGNTKADATAQVTFSGTLAGTAREDYDSITHADGSVRLHGKGFFTGSIGGRSGTLEYVFRGDADSGTIVITKGSGGLAGAHGQLPYVLNTATGVYEYTGSVSFT